jgi:L-alanine-DL-glutamate epimerase-like enolase superfamily enzyme
MSENLFLHVLRFKQAAGTSRGVLHTKPSWIYQYPLPNGLMAQTEFPVIPGLSPEYKDQIQYETELQKFILQFKPYLDSWSAQNFFNDPYYLDFAHQWCNYPSFIFGLELLLLSIQANGSKRLYDTPFTRNESKIPINGLVWMGALSDMRHQAFEKIASGYHTVKIKIGALDWHQELDLLKELRAAAPASALTLRVDANGAFSFENAPAILNELAKLEVHSIEQPIAAGQHSASRQLIANSPLPIGLDEELIGVYTRAEKCGLLDALHPQFLILKPSLHGGFSGVSEWIDLAKERQIGWWLTSALESSIGLNAIVQFGSTYDLLLPQGFGTGGIYSNNFESNLQLEQGCMTWLNAPDMG